MTVVTKGGGGSAQYARRHEGQPLPTGKKPNVSGIANKLNRPKVEDPLITRFGQPDVKTAVSNLREALGNSKGHRTQGGGPVDPSRLHPPTADPDKFKGGEGKIQVVRVEVALAQSLLNTARDKIESGDTAAAARLLQRAANLGRLAEINNGQARKLLREEGKSDREISDLTTPLVNETAQLMAAIQSAFRNLNPPPTHSQ